MPYTLTHTDTHTCRLTSFHVKWRYCLGTPLLPAPFALLSFAKLLKRQMKLHFECNLNAASNRKFAINKCHDNVMQGLPQRVAQTGRWGGGQWRQLATCQATKSNSFFIDKTFDCCCSQGKQQGALQPRPLYAMPQEVMYKQCGGSGRRAGGMFTLLPVNVCTAGNCDSFSLDR